MSKIVNLNHARKAKKRKDARAKADENAARFGLSKAQKSAAKRNKTRTARHLDGHKRSDG
jgi:hypothetical protein